MENLGAIITLVVGGLLAFYCYAYSKGSKDALKDLPDREENLKKSLKAIQEKEKVLSDEKAQIERREKVLSIKERSTQYFIDQAVAEKERQLNSRELKLTERENLLVKNEISSTKRQEFLEKSKTSIAESSAWLAKVYADLDAQKARWSAEHLLNKSRPATTAASEVKKFGKLRQEAVYAAKTAEYRLDYYQTLFPWLEDYLGMTLEESEQALSNNVSSDDEYESAKNWLSPAEYKNLSEAEKWQLALDRYNNREKSKWQIGIEYERYIGYLLEMSGYKVYYNGATKGKEDMGRDLIAENNQNLLIVQCKRWAQGKVIHEKHVFQLYGTTVLKKIDVKSPKKIIGVFVTTARLSDIARQCADYLDIRVYTDIEYKDYPKIKCNYSRSGEKIYHLPFDLQYDKIIIQPHSKDFYAATVQDAVDKGFRHAFRWYVEDK